MQIHKRIEPKRPSKELPNLEEKRAKELKEREMKRIWGDLLDTLSMNEKYKVEIDEVSKQPTVSLSWKKNEKSVFNWMRKHMEAYPETWKGFMVTFIDDKKNWWYRVRLCGEDEKWDIRVSWENYKLEAFEYEENNLVMNERHNKNNYDKTNNIDSKKYRNNIWPNK